MKQMKYIYTLSDPRDAAIRYVGVSGNPKNRLKAHDFNNSGVAVKRAWVKELLVAGLEPALGIVELVDDTLAVTRERHWIETLRTQGAVLYQASNGGDESLCKRGPVKRMGTRGFTVILPDDLGEWGKHQPGGLSQLVRDTLQRIRDERMSADHQTSRA